MFGEAPTYYLTSGGSPIGGSGTNNKGFSREGFVGQFYFGQHVDVTVVTQHGSDSARFGQRYGDLLCNPSALCNSPGPLPVTTVHPPCLSMPGRQVCAGSCNPL